MENLNVVLDDVMVLHLKDDEDPVRDILNDTRKICPICQAAFGLNDKMEYDQLVQKKNAILSDKSVNTEEIIIPSSKAEEETSKG